MGVAVFPSPGHCVSASVTYVFGYDMGLFLLLLFAGYYFYILLARTIFRLKYLYGHLKPHICIP